MCYNQPTKGTAEKILDLLNTPMDGPGGECLGKNNEIRAVFHYQVSGNDVDKVVQKIKTVLQVMQ